MQQSDSAWKAVAYASRSMTETERRYAQIEKRLTSLLVPLLGTKHLDSLPPRVLRFRLRLARFDYSIVHVPGKLLYTADTLSRSPSTAEQSDSQLQEEAEEIMEVSVTHLPASAEKMQCYRKAQSEDMVCSAVRDYCHKRWPERKAIPTKLFPYWKDRGNLHVSV